MSRQLRIVHCFRSPVGGIFRHVRDLARAQAERGHHVGIVCDSTTGGTHEDRLFAESADLFALGVRRTPMQRHIGPGDIAAAWRTYRNLAGMEPDVVHGHGAKGGVYARLFGTLMRATGSPAARLYSPHGGSLHYDSDAFTGRIFFLLERVMDRMTDRLLFVSDYEQQTYTAKVGSPRAPASRIHNGLDDREFVPVATPPEAPDFLYVGMMRDLKGPDIFIDALAEAQKSVERPLRAVMVGDGEGLPRYREQADRLGLSDRIEFRPAMPAREAFALGRIVVVPSRAEAMPYIVLEALAAGKAMIASAVGGIPEIFGPGSPALVEPDASKVAAHMCRALADEPAFAGAMPDRQDLRARFGVATMAVRIEEAYFEALKR